jgi:predicted dehydrogenase
MTSLPLPSSKTSCWPSTRVRSTNKFRSKSPPQELTSRLTDRRWDADFVTLSKLVKNGSLGRVVEFETHFDRHRPEEPAPDVSKWKNKVVPGGGAIYDLGAHLLDQAVQLMGMPDRITGFVGSQRAVNTSGFDDSFTVLLHYNNGLLVTAKAGVVSPEEKQLRYWVRGEKGSFKKVGDLNTRTRSNADMVS